MARKGFAAVVESGSCSEDRERWAERRNCGHLHKTVEAAEACGKRQYAQKWINGSWRASAAWHGYTVHDQDLRRVSA